MIAAVAALAAVCVVLLAVVLVLALRKTPETGRERLLARDVDRLQRALEETTDKLLHVVGRDFNVAPVDVEPDVPDDDVDDPFSSFRYHDELSDTPLLLEPRDPVSGAI